MTTAQGNVSLIPHPQEQKFLLVADGDSWSLPRHDLFDVATVNAMVGVDFGIQVSTLDCLRPDGPRRRSVAFAHDTQSIPDRMPASTRWCSPAEFADLPLIPASHRSLVSRWLSTRPQPGLPWTRPGWFTEAAAWARDRLAAEGRPVIGRPEQTGLRAWSGQLRLPTTEGYAYLKCSATAFGHEAELTRWLASRYPDLLPHVLATEPDRQWLLTADFGPVPGADHPPGPEWDRTGPTSGRDPVSDHLVMVPHLADLQAGTAGHADDLLRRGCPDHRLAVLPELFSVLVSTARQAAPAAGERPLSLAEADRLAEFVPEFARGCAALAAFGIPETVVHQDIWRGNMLVQGSRVLIFDWAESVYGHPFFSLDVVLRDVRSLAPDDPLASTRVRDAYLSRWGRPAEQLERAAHLAVLPGLISRALSAQVAVDRLSGERRQAFAGTVIAHLRAVLRTIEESPCPVAS